MNEMHGKEGNMFILDSALCLYDISTIENETYLVVHKIHNKINKWKYKKRP